MLMFAQFTLQNNYNVDIKMMKNVERHSLVKSHLSKSPLGIQNIAEHQKLSSVEATLFFNVNIKEVFYCVLRDGILMFNVGVIFRDQGENNSSTLHPPNPSQCAIIEQNNNIAGYGWRREDTLNNDYWSYFVPWEFP